MSGRPAHDLDWLDEVTPRFRAHPGRRGSASAPERDARREHRRRLQHIRRRRRDLLEDAVMGLVLAIVVLIVTAGLGVVALISVPAGLGLVASLVAERRIRKRRSERQRRVTSASRSRAGAGGGAGSR